LEVDEDMMTLIIKKRDRSNEVYISAARDILSESRAEQFDAYLKEIRDRYKASLKECFSNK
jgi:hypothetical protein